MALNLPLPFVYRRKYVHDQILEVHTVWELIFSLVLYSSIPEGLTGISIYRMCQLWLNSTAGTISTKDAMLENDPQNAVQLRLPVWISINSTPPRNLIFHKNARKWLAFLFFWHTNVGYYLGKLFMSKRKIKSNDTVVKILKKKVYMKGEMS